MTGNKKIANNKEIIKPTYAEELTNAKKLAKKEKFLVIYYKH